MTNKSIEIRKYAREYILSCINTEGYEAEDEKDYATKEAEDRGHLQFLYDTFKSEAGWNIERVGEYAAFKEWIAGLPSSFNIAYMNSDILNYARKWGSIPEDASDKEEDKIINNYFNYITAQTMQLFKKYKIVRG